MWLGKPMPLSPFGGQFFFFFFFWAHGGSGSSPRTHGMSQHREDLRVYVVLLTAPGPYHNLEVMVFSTFPAPVPPTGVGYHATLIVPAPLWCLPPLLVLARFTLPHPFPPLCASYLQHSRFSTALFALPFFVAIHPSSGLSLALVSCVLKATNGEYARAACE